MPLLLNGGSAVAAQGATLALTIILARALGPAELARYSIMQNTLTTLAAVTQFGLAFTVTKFIASSITRDPSQVASVLRFAIRTTLAFSMIVAILLAAGAPLLSEIVYNDNSVSPFLLLSAISIPFLALNLIYTGALNGAQNYKSIACSTGIGAIALLGLGISGGLIWGAIGAAVALAVSTFLRWYLFRRSSLALLMVPTKERENFRTTLTGIWRFALPAGLTGLTLTPAVWVTNALLTRYEGLTDLGIFVTAFTVKTLVVFIPQQFAAVFFPRYVALANVDFDRGARSLRLATLAICFISSALAISVVLVAPSLMHVFGSSFLEGSQVLKYLMVAAVAESIATILSYRLAAHDKMWLSFAVYSTPKDIILITSAFFLIPIYGSTGLALAHAFAWIYGVIALIGLAVGSPRPGGTLV